jgi:archaellum component FlaF (FlaF/FlaG flagellin family)
MEICHRFGVRLLKIGRTIVSLSVMDDHLPTNNKKGIAMHNDCRVLVYSYTQQVRVAGYDFGQVSFAVAHNDVLVNRRICKPDPKTSLVPRDHHNRVIAVRIIRSTRCPTNQE